MGLSSFFKNVFGSTKESVTELAENAESTFEQAKEAAAPYIEKAEIFAEETIEKVKEASEPIIDKATEYAEKASEVISDVVDAVKTAVTNEDPKETILETVVDVSEEPVDKD